MTVFGACTVFSGQLCSQFSTFARSGAPRVTERTARSMNKEALVLNNNNNITRIDKNATDKDFVFVIYMFFFSRL